MRKKSEKKSKGRLSIELTTTQACNYSCEYCFENDCIVPDDNKISNNVKFIIEALRNLLHSQWYNDTFEMIQLTFWGGEPTLNMKFINSIVEAFESYENVRFYIYTNGSRINELLPLLIRMKDKKVGNASKFSIQVSYDGRPVHDMRRKSKSGNPTSSQTIKAIELLHSNEIEFALKSTLSHKDFKYLPEIWNDMHFLNLRYGVTYALTVDYHNIEIKKYFLDLEESLLEIAALEHKFYMKNKTFLSNIFSDDKKFCSAGKNMLTVDVDGNMYLCHGACYSDSSHDFLSGNIFTSKLIDKVRDNYNTFYDTAKMVDKCENCVAMSCLRCNVKKYEDSSEDAFLDRWHDYACQEELCLYYKTTGRIGRALIEVLKEEKLWDA